MRRGCEFCGQKLGIEKAHGGMDRKYCSPGCRDKQNKLNWLLRLKSAKKEASAG